MIYKPQSRFDVRTECAKIILITKKFRAGNSGGNLNAVMSQCQHIGERRRETGAETRAGRSKQCPQGPACLQDDVSLIPTPADGPSSCFRLLFLFVCLPATIVYLELPVKWEHQIIPSAVLTEMAENA
jgi:hypothetical protein